MADLDVEQEYVALLNLLARVVEANKGTPTGTSDGRYYYAEGLATKLFFHAASALQLYRGTRIGDFPEFRDAPSIDVLARTALETFLTFHYVFSAPKTPEERDFRYWAYKASGFVGRQNLPAPDLEHQRKLAEEKTIIDELHGKLSLNSVFKALTNKQKDELLKGRWRLRSMGWTKIATDAGLSALFEHIYSHMSAFAHSSYLSVLQIKQAYLNKEEAVLIESSMNTIKIVLASFVCEYCELFPSVTSALDANPDARLLAQQWRRIGKNI